MRLLLLIVALLCCGVAGAQPEYTLDMDDATDLEQGLTATFDVDIALNGDECIGGQITFSWGKGELMVLDVEPTGELLALNSGAGPDSSFLSGVEECSNVQYRTFAFSVDMNGTGATGLKTDGAICKITVAAAFGITPPVSYNVRVYGDSGTPCGAGTFETLMFFDNPGNPLYSILVDVGNSDLVADIDVVAPTTSGIDFTRGDVNDDDAVDITDAVVMLDALFVNPVPLPCMDAADANDSETFDIGDPLTVIIYLFLSGPDIPEPFGSTECQADPDGTTLDCQVYTNTCP